MTLEPISLWEIIACIIVLYLLFNPSLLNSITKLKIGDLEIELKSLKEQVAQKEEQINELEDGLENERRLFEDFIDNFDPNAPLKDLVETRKAIRANARNLKEIESLRSFLTLDVSHEDLYITAVSIRERRPVILIPDIVSFLSKLALDENLNGYRLNTIWTLTSALHLSLLSAIRDGIAIVPNKTLSEAEHMLNILENNKRVQADRPDNPMKGIRGPIKHCRTWIKKGFELNNKKQNT
jgi:hypothetical protein